MPPSGPTGGGEHEGSGPGWAAPLAAGGAADLALVWRHDRHEAERGAGQVARRPGRELDLEGEVAKPAYTAILEGRDPTDRERRQPEARGASTEAVPRAATRTQSGMPDDGRGWFRTSDLSRVKRALSH
jgi:hypothetical protein